MSNLFTLTEKPNGSIAVSGKYKFTISSKKVKLNRIFQEDWMPQAFECWNCKKKAMFETKSKRVHEELVIVTYCCAECGTQENEPID